MSTHQIRLFGDPVLRSAAAEVTDIDAKLNALVETMYETMYAAPGVGLAAPQVGVQKQFFVYDIGEGPTVLFNPRVVETQGEWSFDEGCLSLPGLSFEIVRPKLVTIEAVDIDGDDVLIEGDELLGRVFLHEIDHLEGRLLIDKLDKATRKSAMRALREQAMTGVAPRDPGHVL